MSKKLHKRRFTPYVIKRGVDLITKERDKQIRKHGYDVLSDVKKSSTMELMLAAETYLNAAEGCGYHALTTIWPWNIKYYRNENMKSSLIKAGALIAAALDRLNAEYFADEPKLVYDKIGTMWTVSGFVLLPGKWVTEVFQSGTAPTRFEALKLAKEEIEYEFYYNMASYTDEWLSVLNQTYAVVLREYDKHKPQGDVESDTTK